MELINLIKHNYKENIRWYIIIWLLLLIPIIFCTNQTIKLYNDDGKIIVEEALSQGYRDFVEYDLPDGMDLEEYFPVYVGNIFEIVFIFLILSVVIITSVFILSKRNNEDFRNKRRYVALSLLFYFAILCGIIKWCDNVTVLVHPSYESFASLLICYIVCIVFLGIYLGICGIFYRIISWFRHKRKLFMILSILILLPIWILISYFFLIILLSSIL